MNHYGVEIAAFLLCVTGWVLISSTMPTEYWRVSTIEGTVIVTASYYSNLWKMCVHGSTGVSDCKNFESMLAQPKHIKACRGLLIIGIILCTFGNIFSLVGMKCTKIGGSEKIKTRLTFLVGIIHLIGGLTSLCAFSVYGNRVTAEFFDPHFQHIKYELGVGLYIGWSGSSVTLIGGSMYCYSTVKEGLFERKTYIYKGATAYMKTRTGRSQRSIGTYRYSLKQSDIDSFV
ncbi:claudin-10-like [Polyodon spathula]|nr:claudin-10-like [Polyodon spathula]XP_041128341.1 claudin-10-like [Polyodon spathula]